MKTKKGEGKKSKKVFFLHSEVGKREGEKGGGTSIPPQEKKGGVKEKKGGGEFGASKREGKIQKNHQSMEKKGKRGGIKT